MTIRASSSGNGSFHILSSAHEKTSFVSFSMHLHVSYFEYVICQGSCETALLHRLVLTLAGW